LSQSESDHYGVSLLNDCKHGYDSQPSQLRLTLLRSSEWPHAAADRGIHQFCYALYPHRGDWQSAETMHRGYELNQPLLVVKSEEGSYPSHKSKSLPLTGQFLHLDSQNLILTAFKQAEQGDRWVFRVYECEGRSAELTLSNTGLLSAYLDSETIQATNLVELPNASLEQETQAFHLSPWQIATFILEPQRDRSKSEQVFRN
jgi:alpha-mannosidase